jgi:NADH-quinone oxidoreductase subunit A
MPYEAGSNPLGRPQEHRFSVKFYMVAISFILFDLETIFVIPWAIAWKQNEMLGHGLYALGVMLVFVSVLTVGLVYEWKQGGLEWD